MAWPVLGLEEAERLVAWGVDGLITKEYDAVAEGLGPEYAAEEAA
jgi:hypothetical protein